ncbi:outer membrane protein [Azospirillum sp. ST 5-10]|uniref:outer membrane protein n=1 Tax=unclassified Azospirillum TaxID=2630922 RepID=UPI003F4A79F4
MKTFSRPAAVIVAAIGVTCATADGAAAQGLYLRGDVGASFGRDVGGSVVEGTGFAGDLGESLLLEAGVGYQLPYNLRTDVTVGYRPGFAIDSSETLGGLSVSADADVTSWSIMANLYYDVPTGTAFTPYVGGGLGVAFNTVDDIDYAIGAGRIREEGDTKTNFAWSLQAGVAYAMTENATIDLGYRYVDLGEFETGGSSTVGTVESADGDVRAHEVKIGLRYRF